MRRVYDDRSLLQQLFIDVNREYKRGNTWSIYPVTYKETINVIRFYWKAMAYHISIGDDRMFIIPRWGYMVWDGKKHSKMVRRMEKIKAMGFDSVFQYIEHCKKQSEQKKIDAIRRAHYGSTGV